MTRLSLQKRSILHHKRGARGVGPAAVVTPIPALVPPIKPAAPVADGPKDTTTTTATPETPALPPLGSAILSEVLGITTSSTSTIASTSAVPPVTSSVTTTSLLTTPRIPITTSSTTHVVHTATRLDPLTSTLTSTHTHTPSTAARAGSGMSTVTLVSGIGGALGATILLTIVIAFFLRRWRKEKTAVENAFDPSQFRRSAVQLDEDDNTHGRPRPPSMIERRNVAPTALAFPPSPPSAAYPYSDQPPTPLSGNEYAQSYTQHGANQTQYGAVPLQPPSFAAGNQFSGNGGAPNAPAMHHSYGTDYGQGDRLAAYGGPGQGHEQPGYGAPPVPGIHGPGAYAPYGIDPRYPQSQRYPRPQQYQNQQQPQQYQNQQHPQRGSSQDAASLNGEGSISSLVNPFSPVPVVNNLGPTERESPPTSSSPSSAPASSNSELASGPSFVTRQSRDAPPAYTNDEGYMNMKRDVKKLPYTPPLSVVNGSSDSAVPNTNAVGTTTTTESNGRAPAQRPITIYNDDEVYGGM